MLSWFLFGGHTHQYLEYTADSMHRDHSSKCLGTISDAEVRVGPIVQKWDLYSCIITQAHILLSCQYLCVWNGGGRIGHTQLYSGLNPDCSGFSPGRLWDHIGCQRLKMSQPYSKQHPTHVLALQSLIFFVIKIVIAMLSSL